MDVLSDALRVIRLTSAVFFTANFSAPWSITSARAERLKPILAPDAECIAMFHILAEGEPCWVAIEGQAPLMMAPGDLDYALYANSGSEAVDTALKVAVYPKTHYATPKDRMEAAMRGIRSELELRLDELEKRTMHGFRERPAVGL